MAAALAVAFIAASSAHAMDYSYRVFGKQIVIDATGEIEMDEASRLSNWLSAQRWGHRRAYTIVFDSPGGDMYGGVQMATIVARQGLNTGVAHGGVCASACVMAWAAGVHKSTATDARIGVHMARDGDYHIASDATLFYARFVKQTGAPASVVAGLVSTPPQEVYWLSLAELRQWNTTIVDGADTPLNRAYRPQVAQPSPAPTLQPKYAAPNGMLLIPLLSLIMIAAPVYMLTRKPRASGSPASEGPKDIYGLTWSPSGLNPGPLHRKAQRVDPRPAHQKAQGVDPRIEHEFSKVFMTTSKEGKEALIERWTDRKKCSRGEAMRLAIEEWRRENR
jgi:hypothetical protein